MRERPDIMLSGIETVPRIQLGDFILQFEFEPLKPATREIARKELRETPELTKESIEILRELLRGDNELRAPDDNDAWLVRFLRPCKFYPESAYKLIQHYYGFKAKNRDIYDNLLPSRETNIFNNCILTVLPNRDQHGRRMLLIELGKKWKPSKCTLDEVVKGCVLFLEAAILEPETQVSGAVVIFDLDGLSLQQVWQFTPPFAKKIVDLLQDAIPLRVKGLHVVNQPYIFNMVFALFKPFLREKLKKRIVFHGTDRKSLHQHISAKCLPNTYGGTMNLPQISGKQWLELLLQCDEEYEAINTYGYREKIASAKE